MPPQQQNPPPVYYTPEANWVPPLNQPYETNPPRQNNWNQAPPQNNQDRRPYQSDRRMDGQINGNCHNYGKRGHMAKNCWSRPRNNNNNRGSWNNNNRNNNQNNNNNPFRNNNNNNNNRNNNNNNNNPFRNNNNNNNNNSNNNNNNNGNPFRNNPPQVNMAETHVLSLPPTKPYDIIPDLWNAPVNTTVGSLISSGQTDFSFDVLTALNTNRNRIPDVQATEPISTTAMKMKIRVKDQLVVATPDTGAAISIISSFLAEQLELNILPIPAQKIQALNSQTQVARVIEDASLQIQ